MRLQVFLSKAGISSRRRAVKIIESGKISINGKKVFESSFRVNPEKDKVSLKGKIIKPKEKIYIVLNKPKGVTTTKKDSFADKTVMDLLPQKLNHLNPVGRLDKDTAGLLLLTNDGEFINRLTHPRFNVKKLYAVKLDKKLGDKEKVRLEKGIALDEKRTAPCKITLKQKSDIEITLGEGRKRQIKRMFSKLGYKVLDLRRLKEGSLALGELPEGKWRILKKEEIYKLMLSFRGDI